LARASFRVGSVYEPGIEPNTLDISLQPRLSASGQAVEAMRAIRAALSRARPWSRKADVIASTRQPPVAATTRCRDRLKAGLARGVNYSGGRWAHTWAKEPVSSSCTLTPYHPHYLEGPPQGPSELDCQLLPETVDEGTLTERADGAGRRMNEADNFARYVSSRNGACTNDRAQAAA
jgi:hypothetical protein